jgi:hypothetical protein
MRPLFAFGTIIALAAAAIAIGLSYAPRSHPKGRSGFAGDAAADLGYAIWLTADRRTLFVEQRPTVGHRCNLTNVCPTAWHVTYPPRGSSPYVRVPDGYVLPLTWSEVRYALHTGAPAAAPRWLRHVDP